MRENEYMQPPASPRGRARSRHLVVTRAATALSGLLLAMLAAPAAGVAAGLTPLPQPAAVGVAIESDHLIVRFRASADSEQRRGLRRLAGVSAGKKITSVPGLEIATVLPGETPELAAARLSASGEVVYARVAGVRQLDLTTNDTFLPVLWGLQNTGQDIEGVLGVADADADVTEAWDSFAGGPSVLAIADSGVDDDHEDLNPRIWSNPAEAGGTPGVDDDVPPNGYVDDMSGWDWTSSSSLCGGDSNPDPPDWTGDSADRSYHGSHVASTAGAQAGNGAGVAGVNPGVSLMNLRIGTIAGSIPEDDELCAMEYAAAAGARVYNGSYSGPGESPAVTDLIGAHPEVLWVFAAGNTASNNDLSPRYPCATPKPNVICVAASDNREQLGSFSNYGFGTVHLAAPGVSIGGAINTSPGNDYVYLDGTSMASPHVAGAASLLFARHPALSAQDVRTALLQGVDQHPAYDCRTITGGRLNVAKALAVAGSIAAGNPQIPQLSPCGTPPNSTSPPSSPAAPSPDLLAPMVTLMGRNRARLPRTGRFAFDTICNEACSFTYSVRISRVGSFNGAGAGAARTATTVNVRPRGNVRKRLLRRLRRGAVRAVVTVSARDLAGNAAPPARLTMLLRR